MQPMYYIGLDVHNQKISYCVKDSTGKIHDEGWIPATRFDLDRWMKRLPQPWSAALEATMSSGWIYDHLKPHAAALKVAHPLMLRAIAAAKKKNDRAPYANTLFNFFRGQHSAPTHLLALSLGSVGQSLASCSPDVHLVAHFETGSQSPISRPSARPRRNQEGGPAAVKHGQCKLCLRDKPLCESHLMPRALHGHCGDIPVRVGDGVVMPTNRHVKDSLLCRVCENVLGNGGEKWVCPKLIWPDRKFPLFDLLPVPEWRDGDAALYYAVRNPKISVSEITHFALGIFWKAGVHSWKGNTRTPLIDLGEHEPLLRGWLRGESALPSNIVLTFTISRPERAQITFNWPVENPKSRWRTYTFHTLGAHFILRAGNGMPRQMVDTCFYHNPVHPILVSDEVSGIITCAPKLLFSFQ